MVGIDPLRSRFAIGHWRGGWTLTEAMMAFTTLSITMLIAMQLLGSAVSQRREQQRRLTAELEAANAIERILALPWDSLTTKALAEDERWQKRLDGLLANAELHCEVATEEGTPTAKRITVEVNSTATTDQQSTLARLVTWTFLPGEDES